MLEVNDHELCEKESSPEYLRSVYRDGYVYVMKVSDGDIDIGAFTDGLITRSDIHEEIAVVVNEQDGRSDREKREVEGTNDFVCGYVRYGVSEK